MPNSLEKWPELVKYLVKYIHDRGLIFVGSILLLSLLTILEKTSGGFNLNSVLLMVIVACSALLAMWLYYRQPKKTLQRSDIVRVITPQDYFSELKKWNSAGRGSVLLYNIELQTFKNRDILEKTWGNISSLENIEKVILLLPQSKVQRWERVVYRESQEGGFFAESRNQKFEVCQICCERNCDVLTQANTIAFALYQFGDYAAGELHQDVVIFPLTEPFSSLKEPYMENDDPWWNYHHILLFSNDPAVRQSLLVIWNRYYSPARSRSVSRIVKDIEPLQPIAPEVFFEKIHMNMKRRDTLLKHLQPRQMISQTPPVVSQECEDGTFDITYDNQQVLCGHYSGVDTISRKPRQSLVCVGGFTEKVHCRLMELFEKELRRESVLQFFYEVSVEPEFTTLTRYQEDMRNVLSYANKQSHIVKSNKLVLIARSINAFVAALVASERRYLNMLSGLILVAPVFDVIEMMDNYRAAQGDSDVKIEKLWRLKRGYNNAAEWEDCFRDPQNSSRNWLNFFGHDVSLAVLADLFRQPDPYQFRLKRFVDSIGLISQQCPVYILSNPDDPITGSKRAIDWLQNAASGSGKIRGKHFKFIEIQNHHTTEVQLDQYPFTYRDETKQTRESLRTILSTMDVPVHSS